MGWEHAGLRKADSVSCLGLEVRNAHAEAALGLVDIYLPDGLSLRQPSPSPFVSVECGLTDVHEMAIIERKASDGSIVDEKGQVSADVLEALPALAEKKADLNAIGDVSPLLLSQCHWSLSTPFPGL